MIVLDTDHMSLLERATSREGQMVKARLEQHAEDPSTTIISYEEQIRGWMTVLSSAKSMAAQIDAYGRLQKQLENYCSLKVWPFDDRAAAEFQRLKASKLRLGTLDLRIAAIALSRQGLLLSRNLRDFRQVPDLRVEDWTKE